VKVPILSTFCLAALAFVGSGYIGYYSAGKIAYRYIQSQFFSTLGQEDARQLRDVSQTLYQFELSRILTQNTEESLQRNVNYLQTVRAKAPADVRPVIDLRIAADYAVMARLDQQSGRLEQATAHRQSAESLFHTLGWQNLSTEVLNEVADKQVESLAKK
jgi:hypothetical protein